MTPFFLYQLKAGICIMLFIALYYALFRRETFHRFNRFYLTGTLLLSIVLPAIRLPMIGMDNPALSTRIIGAVNVYAGAGNTSSAEPAAALSWPALVYLVLSFLFSVYLIYQVINLIVLIARRGMLPWGDFHIVIMPERTHSFSFFNLVFLSQPANQAIETNPILLHEIAHARQLHSVDILLVQIIKIFQWFNPFVYLAEKALQETHEYLADATVLEQDGQPDRYRLLLLTQVFGIQPGIFSFFNHSLIKNRLTMMTKEKSPFRNRFKYLAALPLIVVLGLMMCCVNEKNDDSLKTPIQKAAEKYNEGIDPNTLTDDDSVYVFVDQQASFQGGDISTFKDWVQKNVVYPPEAVEKGIFGRVTVLFVVDSKGKICNLKVLRGVDPLLDNETLRVMGTSPDWVPAKYAGVNVKQQFVIPVVYMLQ